MKLPEVVQALQQEMPQSATWKIAVLARQRSEEASAEERVVELPVFDVVVDHEGKEINLLTDEGASTPRPPTASMTLELLLARLLKLSRRCSDYSVYSSSAHVSLHEGYEARIDSPIVGVFRNRQDETYGFLRWPAEQWE